jgi:hypothetical protein
VFSVRSVQRCYKQDSWSNELVVGQSLACKNLSKEAEDFLGIRHQATTDEDTVSAVANCRVCELAIALELVVVTI